MRFRRRNYPTFTPTVWPEDHVFDAQRDLGAEWVGPDPDLGRQAKAILYRLLTEQGGSETPWLVPVKSADGRLVLVLDSGSADLSQAEFDFLVGLNIEDTYI